MPPSHTSPLAVALALVCIEQPRAQSTEVIVDCPGIAITALRNRESALKKNRLLRFTAPGVIVNARNQVGEGGFGTGQPGVEPLRESAGVSQYHSHQPPDR